MIRRDFVKKSIAASAMLPILGAGVPENKFRKEGKILNAYYFRAHMYTLVPKHIREDLKWMAEIGTNAITLAILEQDLYAAIENIKIIAEEANKVGIDIYAVPSRWGGLIAGAPKVPSLFSVKNPQTWILNEDGSPLQSQVTGVISSVFYNETKVFFKSSIDLMFKQFNIKGVIWDEPKIFGIKDFSAQAKEKLNNNITVANCAKEAANFFSQLNQYIKDTHPKVSTSLFIYANMSSDTIDIASGITHLDYFGCDGRPWANADGGTLEGKDKTLIDNGPKFINTVKKKGIKSLLLIENHSMPGTDIDLMDKRLPEVMAMDPDHLIYYYYPRNIENPDKNMKTLAKHLKNFRK